MSVEFKGRRIRDRAVDGAMAASIDIDDCEHY
jgi:hypothetical protein